MTGPIARAIGRTVAGRITRRRRTALGYTFGPELNTTPFSGWTVSNVATTTASDVTGFTFNTAVNNDNVRLLIASLKDDTTYRIEIDTADITAGGIAPHIYGPTAAHHGGGTNITTNTTTIIELTTTGTSSILGQVRLIANAGFTGRVTRVSVKEKIPVQEIVVIDPDATPATFTRIVVDNTGTTDVTAAINAAIATPGKYFLPNGTYKIDGAVSIKPKSNSVFQMNRDATLQIKTNGLDSYSGIYVNLVDNVEVFGGNIIGDRDTHTGTTGEGGHCIRVHGSTNCKVHDINLSKGWGDGLYVGPNRDNAMVYSEDFEAWNVYIDNCRRNACSITNANRVLFRDSFCMNTDGTSPRCGIDIEPNADVVNGGTCVDIEIRNVTCTGNQSYGINIQRRAYDVNINHCNLVGNHSCGMVAIEAFNLVMTDNIIKDNGSTGLFLKVDVQVSNVSSNTFSGNYGEAPRDTPIIASGEPAGTVKDLLMNGTGPIGVNTYL